MELEDAALIDGCNRLQALYHVILPLAAPGIVASGILRVSHLSWNEFLLPCSSTTSTAVDPPVGYPDADLWRRLHVGRDHDGRVPSMSIPVLILYTVSQRYVVTGLTAGAVRVNYRCLFATPVVC